MLSENVCLNVYVNFDHKLRPVSIFLVREDSKLHCYTFSSSPFSKNRDAIKLTLQNNPLKISFALQNPLSDVSERSFEHRFIHGY